MTEQYIYVESIFRKKYWIFFKYALKLCKDNEAAKELIAKGFYYLLCYADKLESQGHAEAILNTILKQKWYDEARLMGRRPKAEWKENLPIIISPSYPDYFPANRIVESIMQTLPETYLAVLKAYYYHDLGRQEIAKLLNIELQQVDNIRNRALGYLREPEKIKFFFAAEQRKRRIDEYMELHDAGLKPRHIAKHFGVSVEDVKHSISNRLKKKREELC